MELSFINSVWYAFLDFFTKNVIIGLSKEIAKDKRNGIAWVQSSNGGVDNYPFIVDRPEALIRPNLFTIHSLFSQILKMGYEPVNLEITIGDKQVVYKYGRYRPIFIQK